MKKYIDLSNYTYHKNEETSKYEIRSESYLNKYNQLRSRFIFPENNPSFNEDSIKSDVSILQDLELYRALPEFSLVASFLDGSYKFEILEKDNSIHARVQKIKLLLNEMDQACIDIATAKNEESPLKIYIETQKLKMIKEFVFSKFLNQNIAIFGKAETLYLLSSYLNNDKLNELVDSFNEQDFLSYKELVKDDLIQERGLEESQAEDYASVILNQIQGHEREVIEFINSRNIDLCDQSSLHFIENAINFNNIKIIRMLGNMLVEAEVLLPEYTSSIHPMVLSAFFKGNSETCYTLMSPVFREFYQNHLNISIREIINSRFNMNLKAGIVSLITAKPVDLLNDSLVNEFLRNAIIGFGPRNHALHLADVLTGEVYLTPTDSTISVKTLKARSQKNIFALEETSSNFSETREKFEELLTTKLVTIDSRVREQDRILAIQKAVTEEHKIIIQSRANLESLVEIKKRYSIFINSSISQTLDPAVKLFSNYALHSLSRDNLKNLVTQLEGNKPFIKNYVNVLFKQKKNSRLGEVFTQIIFESYEPNQAEIKDFNDPIISLYLLKYSACFSKAKYTEYYFNKTISLTNSLSDSEKRIGIASELGDVVINSIARGSKDICLIFLQPKTYHGLYDNDTKAQIIYHIITRSGERTRIDLMDFLAKNILLTEEIKNTLYKMADIRGDFTVVSQIFEEYCTKSELYKTRLDPMSKLRSEASANNNMLLNDNLSKEEKFFWISLLHEHHQLIPNDQNFNSFLRQNIEQIRAIRCSLSEMENYFGYKIIDKVKSLDTTIDEIENKLKKEAKRDSKKKKDKPLNSLEEKQAVLTQKQEKDTEVVVLPIVEEEKLKTEAKADSPRSSLIDNPQIDNATVLTTPQEELQDGAKFDASIDEGSWTTVVITKGKNNRKHVEQGNRNIQVGAKKESNEADVKDSITSNDRIATSNSDKKAKPKVSGVKSSSGVGSVNPKLASNPWHTKSSTLVKRDLEMSIGIDEAKILGQLSVDNKKVIVAERDEQVASNLKALTISKAIPSKQDQSLEEEKELKSETSELKVSEASSFVQKLDKTTIKSDSKLSSDTQVAASVPVFESVDEKSTAGTYVNKLKKERSRSPARIQSVPTVTLAFEQNGLTKYIEVAFFAEAKDNKGILRQIYCDKDNNYFVPYINPLNGDSRWLLYDFTAAMPISSSKAALPEYIAFIDNSFVAQVNARRKSINIDTPG